MHGPACPGRALSGLHGGGDTAADNGAKLMATVVVDEPVIDRARLEAATLTDRIEITFVTLKKQTHVARRCGL